LLYSAISPIGGAFMLATLNCPFCSVAPRTPSCAVARSRPGRSRLRKDMGRACRSHRSVRERGRRGRRCRGAPPPLRDRPMVARVGRPFPRRPTAMQPVRFYAARGGKPFFLTSRPCHWGWPSDLHQFCNPVSGGKRALWRRMRGTAASLRAAIGLCADSTCYGGSDALGKEDGPVECGQSARGGTCRRA
jgi:hypothetical protein